MQFILTLLISVRGRGLLKDSSHPSFFGGTEAGLTGTQGQPGGRAWMRGRPQIGRGWAWVPCCQSRVSVTGNGQPL